MRLGVTCLLALCSLSALCEDAKTTAVTVPEVGRNLAIRDELKSKLEWNVEPAYWDGLLGRNNFSDIGSVVFLGNISGGLLGSDFDFASSAGDSARAAEEAKVERVLRKVEPRDGVRLGQSDYVFRSPILEGLVPQRLPDDASLGEKILALPVVRWFRPLPLPNPPGGGRYFKWGSRDKAWAEFNQPIPGPGRTDNGM